MLEEYANFELVNKSEYYTGTSKIFQLNTDTGKLSESLLEMGSNTALTFYGKLKKDNKNIIALYLRNPRTIFFADENFKILREISSENMGSPTYYTYLFPDFNKDGTSEIVAWNAGSLTIFDYNFNKLISINRDFKNDPLRRVLIEDIDSDGKDEIILMADYSISVYSY